MLARPVFQAPCVIMRDLYPPKQVRKSVHPSNSTIIKYNQLSYTLSNFLLIIIIILSNIDWISILVVDIIIHMRRKVAFMKWHIWLQLFTDKLRIFLSKHHPCCNLGVEIRVHCSNLITLDALDQTLSEGADVAGMVKISFASCAS